MGLFDAPAPKPVELTGTSTTAAPQYLTDYLTQLAQTGQQQLGQPSDQLIAGLPQNLQDLYSGAQTTLNRYQTPMDASLAALQSGATGVTGTDISKFYNPYEQDVINRMGEQSALNVQRSLLPALRGAFAGTGGFGSQRYAGALGQTMADVQTGLLGEQAKLRSEGYRSALDAALKERGYDIQAGQGLYGLGQAEAGAGTQALKALGDIGTQELGYEQSKIEAPLTRAQNVAQIMRGYTYPTTTTEKKQVLPGSYGPSPLQQISGLGTLIGSAFGNKDAAGYKLIDVFKDVYGGIKSFLPSESTEPNAGNLAGSYFDSQGNPII